MKLTKQVAPNTNGLKEKKFASVPEFVKWAVQENGGSYETICQQLTNASFIMRRMVNTHHEDETFDITRAYEFLTNIKYTEFYNLQSTPNKFTIKGVGGSIFEVTVQKSIDSIVVTITEYSNYAIQYTSGKQGHKSEHGLITLHFSDHHLAAEYQRDTRLGDYDGADHCLHKASKGSFTFNKTNLVTNFSYTRSDNSDVSWSKKQTKSLPNRKEQDDLTK